MREETLFSKENPWLFQVLLISCDASSVMEPKQTFIHELTTAAVATTTTK